MSSVSPSSQLEVRPSASDEVHSRLFYVFQISHICLVFVCVFCIEYTFEDHIFISELYLTRSKR